MKTKITIVLIIWMIFTLILIFSVVGLFVIMPQINDSKYYKTPAELRSTWMRIGYELKNELTKI